MSDTAQERIDRLFVRSVEDGVETMLFPFPHQVLAEIQDAEAKAFQVASDAAWAALSGLHTRCGPCEGCRVAMAVDKVGHPDA